jgi:hypothetical protein
VQFYEQQGDTDSGLQFDSGKTTTLSDWRLKRRSDVPVVASEAREFVRGQLLRRLLPQIERNFTPARAVLPLGIIGQFERAEAEIVLGLGCRRFVERERGQRELLPHRKLGRGNRQPAELEHVAARFGHASDLGPIDLVDRQSFPLRSGRAGMHLQKLTSPKTHSVFDGLPRLAK